MSSIDAREPAALGAVEHDPFADAPIARVVPATEAQREIWLAAKLDRDASLAYNESIALRLHGPLDVAALEASLQALVDRHEALRATFSTDGAELYIAQQLDLACAQHDLRRLDASARSAQVAARLKRAVEVPFDLEHGPLVRAELLRLADDEHLLLFGSHHIVCDGWSFGVIVRDLAALYAASGDAAALAPAESFADFALAQFAQQATPAHRDDEDYWLSRFADFPAPLDLPTDRARPRQRSLASRREDLLLDADLIAAVKRSGARRGASLYAILLAALGVLLQRLGDQDDDLVVGIPSAGQAAGGHDALVGHAVNVLPLRLAIDRSATFADVLGRARSDLLDAFEHQQYTFGTLLKRLALVRDPGRLPLLDVLFNLDPGLDESAIPFAGLTFEFAGVPRRFENFELFINAVQVGGALRLECQYNADLFDRATIARWLDAYASLLRAAADHPDQPVATLPLLSARGLAALRALQPAPTPFERDARACDLVFAQAARTPARTALRCGERSWSYAELVARAAAIAHAVRARGIGRGDLVGVCLERGPDMVAAILGVLAADAGYVPLDPGFPGERLAFMAADAKLALLLSQASTAGALEWPAARRLEVDANAPATAASAEPPPSSAGAGETVAYVIYTSGSTGKPKGVRVPHRAVVNFLTSMRREPGLEADDRLLAVTTLSFDIAVLELFLPLSVGAQVVLATREESMDGYALTGLLDRHAITTMQATPATWRLLLETGWRGHDRFKLLCGGEPLPAELAQRLLPCCAQLWNLYGPTETTVWSTCARIEDLDRDITIGRPIANTSVWILDAAGQPCPIGVPGEIVIGGDGVTLGYLDRPELTAERFIADPLAAVAGATRYRTGDRGRWRNDGNLEHLGRLDFQVKLRGYRIELGEIEANLATHPGVAHAVAGTREDVPGDVRLIAWIVPQPGATIDETALRPHLRASLPDYMVPQHFVTLDALPLLPNGKLDRKALPAPFARHDTELASAHRAPRDALEQRIATAMEQTLALPGIGIDDDFFALGGHSLLAAQLTARLNREFDITLSLRTLFDAPTVVGVAAAVTAATGQTGSARARRITARDDQHRAPLSLLQKRLWLFEQLQPGSLVYNTPSAHRLRGPLDAAAFERAFNEIVRRQAVLRTSIGHAHGEVVQIVHDDCHVNLFPAEDLSALPPAEREAQLMQRLDAMANEPFDLGHAPLFRAHLFRLADDEHALFFSAHHIIWDGWSFDLFYEEFSALYAAAREGSAAPLPPLPVSYGDFAAWHEQWLQGPEYAQQFSRQLAWWRTRLATHGAPTPLPTDHPRGTALAGRGDTLWIALSEASTQALRDLARRAEATVYMVTLAAYYALLYRVVGDGNLVVGTPVRVRTSAEVEKIMGLFTNLLPLALDVDPAADFIGLVQQVKSVVLNGLSNPDVQLEDLMREPGMREAAGATHFYQAQFSYQDARQRITDWGGLAQSQIPLFQRGASEDLAVWLLEQADGIVGGVTYNADLLDTATAQALADDYLALLDRVIADPLQPIEVLVGRDGANLSHLRRWDRVATRAPALEPAMGDDDTPQTPAEQWLAEIWRELLGVPRIGRQDNFFDLGGHSLLALSMVVKVEKASRVRLNLLFVARSSLRVLAAELPQDVATLAAAPAPPTLGERVRGLFGRDRRR